jgi:hypothetical protein
MKKIILPFCLSFLAATFSAGQPLTTSQPTTGRTIPQPELTRDALQKIAEQLDGIARQNLAQASKKTAAAVKGAQNVAPIAKSVKFSCPSSNDLLEKMKERDPVREGSSWRYDFTLNGSTWFAMKGGGIPNLSSKNLDIKLISIEATELNLKCEYYFLVHNFTDVRRGGGFFLSAARNWLVSPSSGLGTIKVNDCRAEGANSSPQGLNVKSGSLTRTPDNKPLFKMEADVIYNGTQVICKQ